MSAPGNSLDERRRNWIIDKLAGSSAENGRQDAVEPPPPGVTAAHTPRAQGSAPDGVNSVDEERVVGTDIHVSNLSTDTTEDELRDVIMRTGPVKKLSIVKDGETGLSRGYGFYVMENESDVTTSIRNLNGFVLRERTLRVDVAKKQYNGMARKYATTRDPPPQRGDRREYRPDMDRRRYEENRRQEYEYPRTGPPAAPYRSGDSAHSMPYRDLGARGYDYTAGFRESPVSYPMADVAQRYGRDPVDRYMTDSYRPPAAYEPGAALSPALSRYDNRYDIMDGPRRVVADPYSAPGRAAYNPAEARYGAEYRGRDYSDVRSMGVDYAAYAAGRRSRSRSREKYPEPIPAYNRVARAPSGYSGDAYRADRGREGGYGSLIDGPLPPHSSTGYGVPPPSRDAPYASKAYPADDRDNYRRAEPTMPYAGDDYRGRIDDARRQPGGSVAPTSSYEEYQRSRFR